MDITSIRCDMELLPIVFLSFLFLSVSANYPLAPKVKSKEEICNRQFVDIIVSSLVTNKTIRNLELTWDVKEVVQGDWIGMYTQDPTNGSASPVFKVKPTTKVGKIATPFEEKRLEYDNIYEPHCLGYWAVYWRAEKVITKSCLQSNPTWMNDNKDRIGKLKLRELFWPGTHDSGAYDNKEKPFVENDFEKYLFTQDEDIFNQLIHGVRYLDLRVGYSIDGWWIHHNMFKIRPFTNVIDDINKFIRNTNEILIIDFHSFHSDFGAKSSRHDEFMKYLESKFSDQMATKALNWSSRLEDVWASKRRLIISYNYKPLVDKKKYNIWMAVNQKWGNLMDLGKLRNYFENVIKSKPTYAWGAMAEFTPNIWDIIQDNVGGLRKMANSTNTNVTEWFRGPWGGECNIVAMDFVRSSGIVDAAIKWNIIKQNKYC